MFYWDPNYFLFVFLPGLALGIWAQTKLHSAYAKYIKVPAESGLTGAQAARRILDNAGLVNVPVEQIPGELSDHYDPEKKALFLSPDIYEGTSLASVGVAAHEAGHALQHQVGYGLFSLRMALVPVTQFATYASFGILLFGLLLHLAHVMMLAVILFAVMTLFQIVTLPVEYDASARAKEQLFRLSIVRQDEREGINHVLDAAALTYVAAMISSVLQLLYYFMAARDDRS